MNTDGPVLESIRIMQMGLQIPDHSLFSSRFNLLVQTLTGLRVGEDGWHEKLQEWIEEHTAAWWQGVWLACEIKGDQGDICQNNTIQSPRAEQVFANARISVAENIFTFGPLNDDSLIAWAEDGPKTIWSRARLKEMSGRFASAFHELGLEAGDRIVLHLPDTPQKIAAFLGASWMGLVCIIEPPWAINNRRRDSLWAEFSPKVIITCDGYRRGGAWVDHGDFLKELSSEVKDDLVIVPVPCAGSRIDVQALSNIFPWSRFNTLGKGGGFPYRYVNFAQDLAFLHTEDSPEFIKISGGNWLLAEMMNWLLWVDIGAGAHIFVADTNQQLNWLNMVASLATGSDVVVCDAEHTAMNNQILWRIIEREQVKVVHMTKTLVNDLHKNAEAPMQNHRLESVELVLVDAELSQQQKDFLQTSCFVNAKVCQARLSNL